ncbi:serine acetyltransferase [Escherichia coli]|nr:serine acetyltransferase [Escherichia coli]
MGCLEIHGASLEVIGSERPFSWRKAIVRAIKHRRVRYLFWWRIAKYLFDKGGYCRKIAGKIERFILDKYNVTVPLTVNIGKGFDISYLNSVVIGHKVTIGENCSIKPGVTIGLRGDFNDMDIVIGHNVTIGCNATILGGKVRIGNNVTIGAHALVLHDIPDDSTFITKFQSEVICSSSRT